MEVVTINKYIELKTILDNAKKITVLTGAGISTDSGIPDFKSIDHTWELTIPRSQAINKSMFNRKPKLFWKYYKDVFQLKLMGKYKPNSMHEFLVDLEKEEKEVRIFTQNVDGLHQAAGSSYVREVHGTLKTASCPKCKTKYDLDYINQNEIPRCKKLNKNNHSCDFILRPDVVLFGDDIHYYTEALESIYESDVFLVIGTSLAVYPINTLPKVINNATLIKKVFLNSEVVEKQHYFDLTINESFSEILNKLKEL